MITIQIKVLDRDGRIIATDFAYGNTAVTAKAAAVALGRTLRYIHEDHALGPVVVVTGRAVKSQVRTTTEDTQDEVRPDGPETDKGGLIGQQPY